ncbi:MAG: hypothetical protein M3076_05790 [Actinomycetota bacterium]|nr:hypothetical protein [Actinomycetota bacterium]
MRAPRLGAALASLVVITGCGSSGPTHNPDPSALPLVDGASIVARHRQCDPGANAFCAIELVIVAPRYHSSMELLQSEKRHLKSVGWTGTGGDANQERAADSPGHKLRATYATAQDELLDNDLGWIQRPRQITLALSHTVFNRTSALAVMLEPGIS